VTHTRVAAFCAAQQFELDAFQRAACTSLEEDRSVLVAAPTGAGKTVVAEFAVYLTMQREHTKLFYTTPIKALSNQKFQEFAALWGADQVGLLTGDTNHNSGARIVVMTTEVLRNMLYAGSPLLADLGYVVMDEVHYLGDRFRGAVWEEVIIHLPEAVRLVSLSATVSNAEEFGDWLQAVRGDTDVIVSEDRPVPLDQHVLVNGDLIDLFDEGVDASGPGVRRVNPVLRRLARPVGRAQFGRGARRGGGNGHGGTSYGGSDGRGHNGRGGYGRRGSRPDRVATVTELESRHLLPAIVFIFSRVGCDQAVVQLLRAGVRLTTGDERHEIRVRVEERVRMFHDDDLAVLGFLEWFEAAQRGIAAHHAGMLPAFKELVEELFQARLLKVVFATETLALGVNMPARSVVIEKLEKFNGESRVPVTPGEYTQLTGRAGRRGIDVEGHAVIHWGPGLEPDQVASLASRRSYPLTSSFRPSYNMAVNLIEKFGRERTRQVLELSFAQFQADRAVVGLARSARKQEESLAGFAESMFCDLGDFVEYARLRATIGELERQGSRGHLGHAEKSRIQEKLAVARAGLKGHPCHGCPDREQHARWSERWLKLSREHAQLSKRIRTRTGLVATQFDRVVEVLVSLDYLARNRHGELAITDAGRILKRIYGERDLLIAESLRHGNWVGLSVPGLAAMAAALTYEPRRDDRGHDTRMPRGSFADAYDRTTTLWSQLDDLAERNRLPGTEMPSPALASAMYAWADGASLTTVLGGTELAVGDFVRITKQVIDLLDQVSLVADAPVATVARGAIDAVRRGVVAWGMPE